MAAARRPAGDTAGSIGVRDLELMWESGPGNTGRGRRKLASYRFPYNDEELSSDYLKIVDH